MMTPSQEEIAAALREADLIEDMEMDDTEHNLVALASSYRSLVALVCELIASDPEDLGPTCSYVTVQIDKQDYRQALDIAHPVALVQPTPSEADPIAAIVDKIDANYAPLGVNAKGAIYDLIANALRAQLAQKDESSDGSPQSRWAKQSPNDSILGFPAIVDSALKNMVVYMTPETMRCLRAALDGKEPR